MTVTFVLPTINLTGGNRVIFDYANWLHDAGHPTTVVYPCWPYRFQYTRQQQWTEFQKHRRHRGQVPWFDLRCRLLRAPIIRTPFMPRADLVVATAWPTAADVVRLHSSRGRKVMIAFHHESGTGPERLIRSVYPLPFYRIAFSRFVRDSLAEQFGCDVREVVPNGVDTDLFYPDGKVEEPSVLLLYHPDPRKGAADGIDALTRLRQRRPGVRVRVMGTVRPDRLPSWMPFEFHPDDATLRRAYSTSTVLLYPSRYEGFGLPPLEAMACGCPSVTSAVGAVPEYATDRLDALIVPIGDVDAMVDRLDEVLADGRLRQQLSAEGLRTAERYSIDRVAPLFAAAVAKALNEERVSR
jgi:glycosyltransferase involved in cell wall biosynthesis